MRSFQLDASSNTGETRVADPAFKAVLLTPRESTGRPVQPVIPLYELTSGPPHVHPGRCGGDERPSRDREGGACDTCQAPAHADASKPPASRPTFAAPQQQAIAGGSRNPAVATAARPNQSEPKSAGGGFGRSEIAATRAFTRF